MPSKIISIDDKQQLVQYYLSKPQTIKSVGEYFNYSSPTIIKILNEFNVPRWKKAQVFNPRLNEKFFNTIDAEEKAYFLGLIIADGNVFVPKDGNRQSSISITVDQKDAYLLEQFKYCVNSNTNLGHDGRGCQTIAVRSDIMAQDLAKYGVVPRKSYKETFLPAIDSNYLPHLVRGIIDGDGSILAANYSHSLGVCGSHRLMQDLANLFNKMGTKKHVKVYDYKDKVLSEIKINSYHDILLIGEWLYKDASLYMRRKRDNYEFIKKKAYENTEVTS